MSTSTTAVAVKKLECRYCQKAYSKAEHLTRHERSHTGVRPFACKECHRAFSRQDSLARHEKLHLRRDKKGYTGQQSVASTTPKSMGIPTLPTPEDYTDNSLYGEITGAQDLSDSGWMERQDMDHISFMDVTQNSDIDFPLIWPDSEELFQSLLTAEPTPQVAFGMLPLPPTSGRDIEQYQVDKEHKSTAGAIPIGGGYNAVNCASRMILNQSSNVAAEVEASSITSVFLDECLHMFFERFIPTFPILHRPTFVFRESSHALLLNAIAIGSLYIGPKNAVEKGEALWRLAHTALATSWQSMITNQGPHDAVKGLQLVLAALLGQIYAALSRNRALRTTSQIFHGLGFFWARHCAMFDTDRFSKADLPELDASHAEKDRSWRIWAAKEIQCRTLLAHYIMDGQIAQMSGDPTSTRHAANQLGLPSSDSAFAATNADEWLIEMQSHSETQVSFRCIFRHLFSPTDLMKQIQYRFTAFTLRVILEGLQSLVSDCEDIDGAVVGVPSRSDVRAALAKMYECITHNTSLSAEDAMETLLRWHSICLDAATDSALLCRQLCARYNVEQQVLGGGKSIRPGFDLLHWTRTDDARRALIHAITIQNIVEQLPRGRAHVIHMPSALFAAATVYSVFSLAGFSTIHMPLSIDWKDALFTEVDPCVILGQLSGSAATSETRRFVRGERLPPSGSFAASKNLPYELNSMQKLFRCLSSQWGVAHEMEQVIDQWISLSH
ncbi:hypothetical protein AAFC00_004733 [Neodothiora populina]|uniref:C2H2-type domain-containing protein n=1 Tax=Neodothiora populina TaxID=2781224 RepID=A0ABR3P3T0_9PEZI